MESGNSHSRRGLSFIFVFALLVFLLLASRGAMGSVYEYISNVNWVAGILVLIPASIIPVWLVLRYVGFHSEE